MKHFLILTTLLMLFGARMHAAPPAYMGTIEANYSVGSGENSLSLLTLNTAHGIKILDNRLFIGAGIGFGISTDINRFKTYSLPLFVDIRYTLPLKNFAPYIDIKTGYAELTEEAHDGGYYIDGGYYLAPSIGISHKISTRASMYLSVGYSFINASYSAEPEPLHNHNYYVNNFNAGGFNISIGIIFP